MRDHRQQIQQVSSSAATVEPLSALISAKPINVDTQRVLAIMDDLKTKATFLTLLTHQVGSSKMHNPTRTAY